MNKYPSIDSVEKFMISARDVLFPEYFGGTESLSTFSSLLTELTNSDISEKLIEKIPVLRIGLLGDANAMAHNDPAVVDLGEVIICYPFMTAITYHRVAHELLLLNVPLIPRMISEMAHSKTGIDIHPAATIGDNFCIDHGTGVVIGATTIIGNNVMLYQGVTLGAKNFKYDDQGKPINEPRHPILEDNVTIYSNSSILGRIRIGHDTIIGGNIWLTHDVPPGSRILQGKSINQPLFSNGAGI